MTRSCRSRDMQGGKKWKGHGWGLEKKPYQGGVDKTREKERKTVTTESGASSSQPLPDVTISYL